MTPIELETPHFVCIAEINDVVNVFFQDAVPTVLAPEVYEMQRGQIDQSFIDAISSANTSLPSKNEIEGGIYVFDADNINLLRRSIVFAYLHPGQGPRAGK